MNNILNQVEQLRLYLEDFRNVSKENNRMVIKLDIINHLFTLIIKNLDQIKDELQEYSQKQ
jgi:hypothetical protein